MSNEMFNPNIYESEQEAAITLVSDPKKGDGAMSISEKGEKSVKRLKKSEVVKDERNDQKH